jgi:hypothetical protein
LYFFASYYLQLGWQVIIYDRYGRHQSFLEEFSHHSAFHYHPFTVLESIFPYLYNQTTASLEVSYDASLLYPTLLSSPLLNRIPHSNCISHEVCHPKPPHFKPSRQPIRTLTNKRLMTTVASNINISPPSSSWILMRSSIAKYRGDTSLPPPIAQPPPTILVIGRDSEGTNIKKL